MKVFEVRAILNQLYWNHPYERMDQTGSSPKEVQMCTDNLLQHSSEWNEKLKIPIIKQLGLESMDDSCMMIFFMKMLVAHEVWCQDYPCWWILVMRFKTSWLLRVISWVTVFFSVIFFPLFKTHMEAKHKTRTREIRIKVKAFSKIFPLLNQVQWCSPQLS